MRVHRDTNIHSPNDPSVKRSKWCRKLLAIIWSVAEAELTKGNGVANDLHVCWLNKSNMHPSYAVLGDTGHIRNLLIWRMISYKLQELIVTIDLSLIHI